MTGGRNDAGPDELERVTVELGERRHDIVIGDGLIASAANHLAPILRRPFTVVVSDETVAGLYGGPLGRNLGDAGIALTEIVIPPGEGAKSFARLEDVLNRLLAARVERGDVIIALGGGVVGDITGFAASVLRRGIDYIQIPTTLLAQVDSAIGGKTGINTDAGKNLVGAFHQPRLVLTDIAVLDSLPACELRAGYAEIVKYGVIGDAGFLGWLEQHGTEVIDGSRQARVHAVAESCRAKAAVVAADEREHGPRALLNLGHTFAHALEAQTGYGKLRHGEAVAIGIVLALDLSVRLSLCPPGDAARVRRHLATTGLPVSPARFVGVAAADAIIGHMAQDKKVAGGNIPFVLSRGIGDAFLATDVAIADVRAVLEAALAGSMD